MPRRNEDRGRFGWRAAAAGAILLVGVSAARNLPEPELHIRLEVALLFGDTGFAVALIR